MTADESGPIKVPLLRLSEPVSGVVAVAGEVDIQTGPMLEEHLTRLTGSIRLDLSAVTFIDSSGVRALVHTYDHCETSGGTLQIEACSPQVERILQIVGLYDILTGDGDQGPPTEARTY